MAGISIAEEVNQLAANEGARKFQEFTQERRQSYLSQFELLRNKILSDYQLSLGSFQEYVAYGKIAKQMIDNPNKYPSGKGGADILPSNELQNIITEQIKKNEKLKKARECLYRLNENNNIKQYSLQLMGLVLMLKQDIEKSKEEYFSFIYQGDTGAAEAFEIPMHQILFNENYLEHISMEIGDINRWSGAEDRRLRFNSSILEQLKNNNQYTSIQLQDNFIERYNELKNMAYWKTTTTHSLKEARAERKAGNSVIRIAKSYWVISKEIDFQTGFIAQGLYGEFKGDENATFLPDNNPWYGKADTIGKDDTPYSVKSFLAGEPGLVSLNSLYRVSTEIIRVLSSPLQLNTVVDYLKTRVFKGGKVVEAAFNKDIDHIIKILTG